MMATVRPTLAAISLHQRGALEVVVGGAVREIEPHHVDAGADHALEHGGVAGGRAEGGDDLR